MVIHGSAKGWSRLRAKQAKKKPPKKIHKCYQVRKDKLGDLGYSSYQEYLKSDDWKTIRSKKLDRYKRCLLCSNKATQVHHLDYNFETLLGMADHRLIQLCNVCHETIEYENGRKLTVREATGKLFKLAKQSPKGQKWIEWYNSQKNSAKRQKKLRRKK